MFVLKFDNHSYWRIDAWHGKNILQIHFKIRNLVYGEHVVPPCGVFKLEYWASQATIVMPNAAMDIVCKEKYVYFLYEYWYNK